MTPCGSYKNRRFGGSYRLHLQGERVRAGTERNSKLLYRRFTHTQTDTKFYYIQGHLSMQDSAAAYASTLFCMESRYVASAPTTHRKQPLLLYWCVYREVAYQRPRSRPHRKRRTSIVALRVFGSEVFNGQLPSNALTIQVTIWITKISKSFFRTHRIMLQHSTDADMRDREKCKVRLVYRNINMSFTRIFIRIVWNDKTK
jgi:hypothetical protein